MEQNEQNRILSILIKIVFENKFQGLLQLKPIPTKINSNHKLLFLSKHHENIAQEEEQIELQMQTPLFQQKKFTVTIHDNSISQQIFSLLKWDSFPYNHDSFTEHLKENFSKGNTEIFSD